MTKNVPFRGKDASAAAAFVNVIWQRLKHTAETESALMKYFIGCKKKKKNTVMKLS